MTPPGSRSATAVWARSMLCFLLQADGGGLLHVGKAARLDEVLGQGRPLMLECIRPDAWPALHAALPSFPYKLPVLVTEEARSRRERFDQALRSGHGFPSGNPWWRSLRGHWQAVIELGE